MLKRSLVLVFCCVLAGAAAHAQAAVVVPSQTERMEAGFAEIGGQSHVAYSIRLMPVSSFPQLPGVVAKELDAMGCMIPQTYEAREPENVIRGSFERKGSTDWAALCSVRGVTTLYVFFASNLAHPIALRSQADSVWLGREWGEGYGSAWGISTRPSRLMPTKENADHDGIEDAFVERSRVVHYFKEGHWATLDSAS